MHASCCGAAVLQLISSRPGCRWPPPPRTTPHAHGLQQECNLAGRPVFVTRVVDTMTDAPRPTRAEATDVANLVLDGADGIVLGSETFRGKFPVASVETVLAICRTAEKCFDSHAYYNSVMDYAGYHSINPRMSKVRTQRRVAGTVWLAGVGTDIAAALVLQQAPCASPRARGC
jgi:pyruvate kinase